MTTHEEDFVRGRRIALLVHTLNLLRKVLPLREARGKRTLVLEAEVVSRLDSESATVTTNLLIVMSWALWA